MLKWFYDPVVLAVRGESPVSRVASAEVPDARRGEEIDVIHPRRIRNEADGPSPPQPEGR